MRRRDVKSAVTDEMQGIDRQIELIHAAMLDPNQDSGVKTLDFERLNESLRRDFQRVGKYMRDAMDKHAALKERKSVSSQ